MKDSFKKLYIVWTLDLNGKFWGDINSLNNYLTHLMGSWVHLLFIDYFITNKQELFDSMSIKYKTMSNDFTLE